MAKYQAYLEYKDSGIEWLGEVPSHWGICRLGDYALKIGSGKTPKGGSEIYQDDGVLFLRSQNIYDNGLRIEREESVYISKEIDTDMAITRVQSGDILLNITGGSIGRTCIVPVPFPPANVNQHVCIVRMPNKLKNFISFFMKSTSLKQQIDFLQNGGNREGLNFEQIRKFSTVIPPDEELEKIANFLDYEIAKIDRLIEKQQQLIQLLKEKRQAVISHAVTKGLNPNAPMKDSGVEWLGKVPKSWDTSYLGFECSVKARLGWKGLKAEEYVDEGFIFLATPNIKGEGIDFENVNYITKQRYDESPEIMLETGDVLVTKDGSTTGTTNIIKFLPSPATVNSSIAVLRSSGRVSSLYLYYFFVSTYTQNVIKRMQGGMGVPHLFQADLRKFFLLVPPKAEQDEITIYIESKLPKFDLLISQAIGQIDLLKERRTALIFAAVTGKIDVRNWQAPPAQP